ncbi:collagen-like protein [Wolbachia endosymbiont of Ctenocephalides felis wCfeJ]|uniref:collagen-like protein n=1 Tax=Wolbachia endosymbiont of Ctenocephalides felis wCfeJ TaxID=2732594 RepID=UPI001447F4F2|nr:collagen-like protein [Wolbachia endosymbiont of Ctenocephalides felis wCfeJ]WCR58227.1 MAG: hypothetical protein PG980_000699 [Wolbachia endosymbiont of Ctenocephalides felis wCfeJ]
MTRYLFEIRNSQKIVSNGDRGLTKIELKSVHYNKEIKFCHANFGTCGIDEIGNIRQVLCWVSNNTDNFCMSERMLLHTLNFDSVEAQVVLNDNCEYRISLYDTNGGARVILPRSLILNKDINLKNYYNKKIKLEIGEKIISDGKYLNYYTPKVTCEGIEICKLESIFIGYGLKGLLYKIPTSGNRHDEKDLNLYTYVLVEKRGNEFLAYFSNSGGEPINAAGEIIDISDIYKDSFNVHLRSALLEHSNIREVLPEFREVLPEVNIDNSMCSDIRQLGCLVDNNIKKIASELATDSTKKSSISRAIVDEEDFQNAVKSLLNRDGNFRKAVASDSNLRTTVVNQLKGDKIFQGSVKGDPGKDGTSPNPSLVAAQLLTGDKKDTLVTEVAGNKGLQDAVATNLKGDPDFQGSVKGEDANPLEIVNRLKHDGRFKREVRGEKGEQGLEGKSGSDGKPGLAGPKGEDANPLEIVNRLKRDSRFKREIRGEKGEQGPKGEDANPIDVAQELATDSSKRYNISNEIAKDIKFQNAVKYLLNIDGGFKSGVGNLLKSDEDFKKSIKGAKGEDANPIDVAQELATESSKRYNISNEIAKDIKFQNAVKYLLNIDGGFKSGVGNLLKSDEDFKKSIKGVKGEDANPLEIVNRLKHDSRFKREIRGEDGQPGPVGPKGKDVNPAEVARKLVHDSSFQSSIAGNSGLRGIVTDSLKNDENFQNSIAQELIAKKANELGQALLNIKRQNKGVLVNDPDLQEGVAAQLLTGDKKDTLVTEVAGNQDLQNAVATNLQGDEIFKSAVKGDSGPQGPAGKDGTSADPSLVAAQLLTGKQKDTLVTAVDGNQVLQDAVANNQDLKDAVTDTLKNEGNLGGGDISKIVDSLKPKFTLQKGEKLSEGIYEAKVILDDKVVATLPKIGYYMLDDQLVMYNYATQEKVVIPEDFLCLKVVRLGSGFGNDDYKLTFCNIRGNEFFEYKKYDPEYSRVPDEYKFISLSHAKKEYNPNLSELISHRPLFLIAGELAEQGSDKYEAAVFELTRDGKGKKMATLNEFGCFNQNGQFMHCNYHKEPQCRSYTSAEIDEKYQVTDADSEFYLTKYNDIAIHTIPEL